MLTGARIDAFVNPTEDRDRVLAALHTVAETRYASDHVTGSFGEPFTILRGEIKRPVDLQRLAAKLRGLAYFMDDEGRAFMRIDKQAAFAGRLETGKGIKAELRFSSQPFDIAVVRSEIEVLFGEPMGRLTSSEDDSGDDY